MAKNSKSRARRAKRKLEAFYAETDKIRAAGHDIRCLNPVLSHYRITNPNGGSVDFWGTTHTWLCPYIDTVRGKGVDTLLDTLPTVATEVQSGGELGFQEPMTTIFADGSWCPRTKAGGWGAWIKADERSAILKGGSLAGRLKNNVEAEARALANAVHLAVAHGAVPIGGLVMLQSDCLAVLAGIMFHLPDAISSRADTHSARVIRALRLTRAMQESEGMNALVAVLTGRKLRVIVRHVKGHKTGSGRAWVNQQCDRLAYAGMKAARAQLEVEGEAA